MKHIWYGSPTGASVSERIKGTRRFVVILVLASVMPCLAVAGPILSFEYVGSGQIVSPTSLVVVQGRLTNSGDSALVSGTPFGTVGISQPAYNQYSWLFPGPVLKFGPSTSVTLAAGASITWTIGTLQTWPFTGIRGGPVPAGTYFLTPGNFSTYYLLLTQIDPLTGVIPSIPVLPATSNFVWTVTSSESVPEPESWALLGGGLIALLVFGNRTRRLVR